MFWTDRLDFAREFVRETRIVCPEELAVGGVYL
jgi:hypothetical protein